MRQRLALAVLLSCFCSQAPKTVYADHDVTYSLRALDKAPCPKGTTLVPQQPIGQKYPQFYSSNQPDPHNTSATAVQRCCPGGSVAFWNLTATNSSNAVYLGGLGALCSGGTVLPSVEYGANGADSHACPAPLANPQLISIPTDGKYTYWSGAIVDQFLGVGVGDADKHQPYNMQCSSGLQPIGFSVASSCFALTQLQIACGAPNKAD